MNSAMLYLTLRHYEYAVAIAQAGSLSAAADVLNVSQPSLSNALTTIEARLDQRLFLRGRGQALTITSQGRHFVKEAGAVLAAARRLERSGQDPLPRARISLGVFTDLAPFFLAPALSAIRATRPRLAVSPQVNGFSGLMEDMVQGVVDLCITWDIGLDARFDRCVLGTCRPHVFLPPDHPLTRQPQVRLADLADQPLILSDDGLSAGHMLRLCAQAGFVPVVAYRAASVEVMRAMAAHDEGIGLSYSAPPARHSYDGKPVVTIPIADGNAAEPVILTQLGRPQASGTLADARNAIRQVRFKGFE